MLLTSFSRSIFCRITAVTLAASLAFSASAQGLHAIGAAAFPYVLMLGQGEPPMITGSAQPINYGSNPARDELGRHGIWTSATRIILSHLEQAATFEKNRTVSPSSYVAAENFQTAPDNEEEEEATFAEVGGEEIQPQSGFTNNETDPGTGQAMPWEAYFPGGGSPGAGAIVNSNTGNRLTSVPIFGLGVRGGLEMGLTLYHNSRRNQWLGATGVKWSTNLDARLHTNYDWGTGGSGRDVIVTWGDGTPLHFAYDQQTVSWKVNAGFYDKFEETPQGGQPGWTVITPEGVRYLFVSPGTSYGGRAGVLKSISDMHGNTITFGYESANSGRIVSMSDPTGRNDRRYTLGYDTSGRITNVKDNYATPNNVWDFTYQGSNLHKIIYPAKALGESRPERIFTYDDKNNIASETDLRGKLWTSTHDLDSRCIQFKEPGVVMPPGQSYNGYRFNYTNSTAAMEDPLGKFETHFYSSGQISSIRDAANQVETFVWDPLNDIATYIDQRGKSWLTYYDESGNVTKSRTPLGYESEATYNSDNQVLTTSNESSPKAIFYTYSNKNLTHIKRGPKAGGAQQTLVAVTGHAFGQPGAATVYPGSGGPNRPLTFGYDAIYGTPRSVSLDGVTTSANRHLMGWVKDSFDGLGNKTEYVYMGMPSFPVGT